MRDSKGKFVKGHKHTQEVKQKISSIHKGKPAKWVLSDRKEEIGKKISAAKKGVPGLNQRGEKSGNWKGGITPINTKIRHSLEYKLWRESVFKRDNWTCVWCKQIGGKLNADHIKPFASYPELRFAIDNGRTLCYNCHKTTDTYGRPKNI